MARIDRERSQLFLFRYTSETHTFLWHKVQFFWDPAIFLSLTPLLLVKNNAMDLHNITVLLPFPAAVLACPVVPAVPSFPLAYFFVYTFPFLLSPDFLVTIPM